MNATTITCDHCGRELTEDQYDAGEGLCDACHALHAECDHCGERVLKTELHKTRPTLCVPCGDSAIEAEAEAALDAAADELRDAVEAIIDRGELSVIRDAVAALKRLVK
jgi:methionyl-tRNA synthetase